MSQQEWLNKDFYAILGVSKDASAEEIKKAYRKKARELHPDRNPGDSTAEEKLKQVSEAYSVLNNPEHKQQYDAIRAMGAGGARFAAGAGGPGGAGFEDIFGSMFGGGNVRFGGPGGAGQAGGPDLNDILSMFGGGAGFGGQGGPAGFGGQGGYAARPRQGEDINARTRLSFRDAALGTEVRLTVEGRTITARIPAGVHDGQRIRLRGKGRPGHSGAPAGDLMLRIEVEPHPVWSADGANLRITVPVTYEEAVLGAKVAVPLLDGGTVTVKVPAGSPSGKTLRVRGKGLVTAKKTGDLLVTVQVTVPEKLSREAKKALAAYTEALGEQDPRADLAEDAAR